MAGFAAAFARGFANSPGAEDTPLLAVVTSILWTGILPVCIGAGGLSGFSSTALPLVFLGWPVLWFLCLAGAFAGEPLSELAPWSANEERG